MIALPLWAVVIGGLLAAVAGLALLASECGRRRAEADAAGWARDAAFWRGYGVRVTPTFDQGEGI